MKRRDFQALSPGEVMMVRDEDDGGERVAIVVR
jgi:hypothetical protein